MNDTYMDSNLKKEVNEIWSKVDRTRGQVAQLDEITPDQVYKILTNIIRDFNKLNREYNLNE